MNKVCSRCGESKPVESFHRNANMPGGRIHQCRDCCGKYRKAYRASHRIYDPEKNRVYMRRYRTESREKYRAARRAAYARAPEKFSARSKALRAIRSGKIQKMPCEVCGDLNSEAHHDDYSKPLEVRWFCFRHHRESCHGQTVS